MEKNHDQYEKTHYRHTDGNYPCNNLRHLHHCNGLIIAPSGADYTVTSSNPDTVAADQVLTFWVAVAKAEGSGKTTASNNARECGSVTLIVGLTTEAETTASRGSASLTDNDESLNTQLLCILP